MRTTFETISPEQAAKILANNNINRPLMQSWIKRLSAAMKRGEWRVNGEAIKIDEFDCLLDGQHRLHACILAQKPLETMVVRDLPAEVFDTLDQGKRRSAADVLAMRGMKNCNALASALRGMFMIESGVEGQSITTAQIEQKLDDHPDIVFWVNFHIEIGGSRIFPSILPTVMCLASRKHGEKRPKEFMMAASNGAGLAKGSPILMLRERFIEQKTTRRHRRTFDQAAYIIKAWNAYIRDRPMGVLRMFHDETMPVIQ